MRSENTAENIKTIVKSIKFELFCMKMTKITKMGVTEFRPKVEILPFMHMRNVKWFITQENVYH